jgi:ketosteroid isomerase-like protein
MGSDERAIREANATWIDAVSADGRWLLARDAHTLSPVEKPRS